MYLNIVILITVILSFIIGIVNIVLIFKAKNSSKENENIEFFSQTLNEFSDRINYKLSDLNSQISSRIDEVRNSETAAIIKVSEAQSNALMELSNKQNESFLQLRNELSQSQSMQRKELSDSNDKMLSYVQNQLQEIQRSNSQSLESIRKNVDEKLNNTLTERLNSSFATISTMLDNVYKSLSDMKELSSGVTNLNKVFSNVKSRGTWAEYQLENILEQTIPGMYQRNFKPEKSKGEIVEFAIMIPAQNGQIVYLPVDSKFPVESYQRLTEAAENCDKDALESAKKEFDNSILAQAKEIRKYIKEPVTTPFAVMYLATEGLYSEAIKSKAGIIERCQNEYSVMIAGPSTITALLSSLQVGFRAMKVNEKAEEIRKILEVAKGQYIKFQDALEKVKSSLDKAGSSIDAAVKRNNIIVGKLKKIDAVEMSDEAFGLLSSASVEEEN